MKTMITPVSHLTEEELDQYCRGMLPEEEAAKVEEHYLLCYSCQDRVDELDNLIYALGLETSSRAQPAGWLDQLRYWWQEVTTWRNPVYAATALAAVTLTILLLAPRQPITATKEVIDLKTFRGGSTTAVEAGRPLEIHVSLEGLPSLDAFRAEIVDGSGRAIWQGLVQPSTGRLILQPAGLDRAGTYWVRLYQPAHEGELLREFDLLLK